MSAQGHLQMMDVEIQLQPQDPENPQQDTEPRNGREKLLEGFPQTSDFIAKDPAKTTVIFRRFDQLAVRNLLYLEARLAALEKLQKTYDTDDFEFNNKNEPITSVARSWETFAVLGEEGRDSHSKLPESALKLPESALKLPESALKLPESALKLPESALKLPESALKCWKYEREKYIDLYKRTKVAGKGKAGDKTSPIIDPNKIAERQSLASELEARGDMTGLADAASEEGELFYQYPSGCGPCSSALIRLRWELAAAIEASLKDYQSALLNYREMLRLEAPAERTKTVVSKWIVGTTGRQDVVKQFMPESSMDNTYDHGMSPDLVGVGRIAEVDLLTRLVLKWKFLYHFKDKRFGYPELDYVPEKVIYVTVTILTVVSAVIMVIGGIWGLYYLRVDQDHFFYVLILLSVLIVLFAGLVKLISTASRTELFIATAGYTAVLVVFVAVQAPAGPQHQAFEFVLKNATNGSGTISG